MTLTTVGFVPTCGCPSEGGLLQTAATTMQKVIETEGKDKTDVEEIQKEKALDRGMKAEDEENKRRRR